MNRNFMLSICLLITLDRLSLRPSLQCNTSLHFSTLHLNTLNYSHPEKNPARYRTYVSLFVLSTVNSCQIFLINLKLFHDMVIEKSIKPQISNFTGPVVEKHRYRLAFLSSCSFSLPPAGQL